MPFPLLRQPLAPLMRLLCDEGQLLSVSWAIASSRASRASGVAISARETTAA
ncbi:MAG: hypothetical protein KME22_09210 [Hassallia sp. WJT32-NPBG1]|jgi:hypothetical protein|nr:hypothetical protein [Hassallia sp. WJT32-NPBG1]